MSAPTHRNIYMGRDWNKNLLFSISFCIGPFFPLDSSSNSSAGLGAGPCGPSSASLLTPWACAGRGPPLLSPSSDCEVLRCSVSDGALLLVESALLLVDSAESLEVGWEVLVLVLAAAVLAAVGVVKALFTFSLDLTPVEGSAWVVKVPSWGFTCLPSRTGALIAVLASDAIAPGWSVIAVLGILWACLRAGTI